MHTFTRKIDTGEYNINYNPDGSGMAIICLPNGERFSVPLRIIGEFAAELVRMEKIAKIESMDWRDIIFKV